MSEFKKKVICTGNLNLTIIYPIEDISKLHVTKL